MKAASNVIAAVIVILLLYPMVLAIDQFRLEDREEPFNVTTGDLTTANITLSQDLYNDDTKNVSEVTSNYTADAAVASTYTKATNYLLVTGLTENVTRQLDVTYSIGRLEEYYGAAAGSRVIPVLLILGILSIVGGAGYQAFNRRGD